MHRFHFPLSMTIEIFWVNITDFGAKNHSTTTAACTHFNCLKEKQSCDFLIKALNADQYMKIKWFEMNYVFLLTGKPL